MQLAREGRTIGGRRPDAVQVVREGRIAGEGEDDGSNLRIDVLMLLQVVGEGRTVEEGGGKCASGWRRIRKTS